MATQTESPDEVSLEGAALLAAFAGADRFQDDCDEGWCGEGGDEDDPPKHRAHRARQTVPWQFCAVFTGVNCASEARETLREHAGDEWFDSKGKVKKTRETHLAEGIPLAQTPRVNKDGTIVSEARCPFYSVRELHCSTPCMSFAS